MGMWSKNLQRSRTGILRKGDSVIGLIGDLMNFFDDLLVVNLVTVTVGDDERTIGIKIRFTKLDIELRLPEYISAYILMDMLHKSFVREHEKSQPKTQRLLTFIINAMSENLERYRETNLICDLFRTPHCSEEDKKKMTDILVENAIFGDFIDDMNEFDTLEEITKWLNP